MAPEVTNVGRRDQATTYDGAADIWSLGVILYVMVAQAYPFGFDGPRSQGGVSAAVVYKRIREGKFDVPESASPELSELLHGLLTTDPALRWNSERIQSCGWVAQGTPYVPRVGAPPVAGPGAGGAAEVRIGDQAGEIKVPPRSQPRMRGAGSSFGSLGGSFLGFPSFNEPSGMQLGSGGGGHMSSALMRTSAMPPSVGSGGSFDDGGAGELLSHGMSGLDLDDLDHDGGVEYTSDEQPLSIGRDGSMFSMGGQTPPSVRMTGAGPPMPVDELDELGEEEDGF
jgi:hypothetical protein